MTGPVVDQPAHGLPRLLQVAAALALLAAIGGTLTSGRSASVFGGFAVAVVIAAPLLRVALLAARWQRIGDRRFALAACGLLLVTGVGAALALL